MRAANSGFGVAVSALRWHWWEVAAVYSCCEVTVLGRLAGAGDGVKAGSVGIGVWPRWSRIGTEVRHAVVGHNRLRGSIDGSP